jgi:hypothetical protein
MTTAEVFRATKFSGTGLRFEYNPKLTCVSTRQITALMDGFGYDQTTCVHDDQEEVVVVAAVKHYLARLDDHGHEVAAIRKVVRQEIEVTYYRLRVIDEHVYEADELAE